MTYTICHNEEVKESYHLTLNVPSALKIGLKSIGAALKKKSLKKTFTKLVLIHKRRLTSVIYDQFEVTGELGRTGKQNENENHDSCRSYTCA